MLLAYRKWVNVATSRSAASLASAKYSLLPYPDRALVQALLDVLQDLGLLLRCGDVHLPVRPALDVLEVFGGGLGRRAGERGDAAVGPGGSRTVVDRQVLLALRVVPLADRQDPGLQLEHRRHALHGLHAVVADVLPVGVEIDETGGDHMACGINRLLAGNLVRRDGDDPAVLDANIAHGIEVGLRVHDPAVEDHHVVGLRDGRNGGREEPAGQGCRSDDACQNLCGFHG
jgi:hypothetical protein